MSIHYDEKGKFFTDVVSKEPHLVIIQTLIHRIEGQIYARHEERVKDAINDKENFLAVTDGTIFNSQGKEIYKSDFMLVNSDQIVWIIPNDEA